MKPILRAFLNKLLGDRAERAAAAFLRKQGMRILSRGYRTGQGQIDLIARDRDVVVFVEVKARRRGVPAEAVTLEKQRRLTLAALHFQRKYGLLDCPARFDVVSVLWPDDQGQPAIEHIPNAFEAVGRRQMFR
jgi:putative endonuclease